MADAIPWWILLLPFVRPAMTIVFVLLAGAIQGRTSGRWPSLAEWASAVTSAGPQFERQRSEPPTQIDPPPGQDDGPIAPRDSTPQ
jgi:hypothetical protein